MRKLRRYILAAAMLALWFISCSGHRETIPLPAEPPIVEAAEAAPLPLSNREKLLCTALWGTSEELRFKEDRSGAWLGQPFTWQLKGDKLQLSFFPKSSVGREMVLKLTQPGSRAELKGESLRFRMGFLLAPSNAEKREQQRIEAHQAALRAEGEYIAQMALNCVGLKYKYGGKSPDTGFDCSGLVYYLYGLQGYSLQRVAAEQAKQGIHVEAEELMPGDVLAFHTSGKYVGHIGIYVGNGYYVHAMGAAYGVQLTALDDPYLKRDFEARRFVGCEELKTPPETPAA